MRLIFNERRVYRVKDLQTRTEECSTGEKKLFYTTAVTFVLKNNPTKLIRHNLDAGCKLYIIIITLEVHTSFTQSTFVCVGPGILPNKLRSYTKYDKVKGNLTDRLRRQVVENTLTFIINR